MLENVPLNKVISEKALVQDAYAFLRRVFYSIDKAAKPKPKAFLIKEVDFSPLTYTDVEYDEDGWADASVYAPARFEIVRVKTVDGRDANGWYKGGDWFSLRLGDKIKVSKWKKTNESFIGGPVDVV